MSLLESYTSQQQIILVVITKFSSCLSIAGSALILHKIISPSPPTDSLSMTADRRKQNASTKERLIAGMSIFDLLGSICWLVGPWAFPRSVDVWSASGTSATCTAQGFVFMLSYAVLLYQMALAIFFLTMTKRSIKTSQGRGCCTARATCTFPERLVHGAIVSYALTGAVLGVVFDAINPKGVVCMVTADVDSCELDDESCQKNLDGAVAGLGFLFVLLPLLVTLLVGGISMVLLYFHVRGVERKMRGYVIEEEMEPRFGISKQVGWQGIWYMVALLVCWIPALGYNVMIWTNPPGTPFFGARVAMSLTNPMQGFFNVLVYWRGLNQSMVTNRRRPAKQEPTRSLSSKMQSVLTAVLKQKAADSTEKSEEAGSSLDELHSGDIIMHGRLVGDASVYGVADFKRICDDCRGHLDLGLAGEDESNERNGFNKPSTASKTKAFSGRGVKSVDDHSAEPVPTFASQVSDDSTVIA